MSLMRYQLYYKIAKAWMNKKRKTTNLCKEMEKSMKAIELSLCFMDSIETEDKKSEDYYKHFWTIIQSEGSKFDDWPIFEEANIQGVTKQCQCHSCDSEITTLGHLGLTDDLILCNLCSPWVVRKQFGEIPDLIGNVSVKEKDLLLYQL